MLGCATVPLPFWFFFVWQGYYGDRLLQPKRENRFRRVGDSLSFPRTASRSTCPGPGDRADCRAFAASRNRANESAENGSAARSFGSALAAAVPGALQFFRVQ